MPRRLLPALFLLALAVRLAALAASYVAPRSLALRDYAESRRPCAWSWRYLQRRPECAVLAEDEQAYDALGKNIAAGRGFVVDQAWVFAEPGRPTAYGNFLYPAFVGAVYAVAHDSALALFLVQSLLGALAVAGIALAAWRLGGRQAALAAGLLGAVHPGLALDSAWVMSEALAVPLLLGAYLVWTRYLERASLRLACAFGVAAAAACLTRSPALFALGLMVVLSLPPRHGRWAPAARHAIAALAVFVVCVAPWAIRNRHRFGEFIPFDTKSGAALWLFNHPGPAPWREAWDGAPNPDPAPGPVPGLNEAQADAHFRGLALEYAGKHPATFAGVSAFRLGLALVPAPRYWGRWLPVRVGVAAFYVALTWLALAGLWMARRESGGRALAGIVLGWLLTMSLTAPGLRFRLAAEWAFVVAASLPLAALLARRGAGRPQPPRQSDSQKSATPRGPVPPS